MIKLSIIIPAYNEESRIKSTLDKYYDYLYKKLKNEFEIIIVPNNCKDKTCDVVRTFSKSKHNIKYFNIPNYVGKGGAILKGFEIAKGKIVGFVDADCSTSPKAFYELYENINNYDSIIASRWIKGAKVIPKQPINRRIVSRTYNIIVNILFNLKLKDTQCGAKMFKSEPLMKSIKNITTKQWAFDTDLLYQLHKNKYTIKEYPTEWSEYGGSTLNIRKASIEMFFDIIKLRLINSPLKFLYKK